MVVLGTPVVRSLTPRIFDSDSSVLERARQAYDREDYVEALRLYETLLSDNVTNADLLALVGATLFKLQRFDAAVKALREASQANPEDASVLNVLGAALASEGKLEEARQVLLEAHRLLPDDPDVLYNLALSLAQLGSFREAVALLADSTDREHSARVALQELRRDIVDASLHQLAHSGVLLWSGKRAKGSRNPVPVSKGPPVSDYVVQDRQ